MSSSSSSSPCAACKFLRRKCTQGCVFAPYFPPDQPSRFANVHRVFGASNVAKLLNDLPVIHREDAVNSLAYEAEARLRDPIYGCVGYISALQTRLKQLQNDLFAAKKDLANYIGLSAFNVHFFNPQHQFLNPQQFTPSLVPVPEGSIHPYSHPHPNQEQQTQILESAMAAREHEMLRAYNQHHHHHQQQQQQQIELARFGSGFEDSSGFGGGVGVLTVAGPELALHPQGFEPAFPIQQSQPQRQELVVQQDQEEKPEVQQHHRRSGSDKDRSSSGSVMGPSC